MSADDVVRESIFDVPPPGPWAALGACLGAGCARWFPKRGGDVRAAKAVCDACPVLDPCRSYGLAYPQLLGVWGGLSQVQRIKRSRGQAA